MITVKNYETLTKLPSTPTDGEYAVCTDEKTAYRYTEGSWVQLDGNKDAKLFVSLYELNKTLYKSMPEITFNELQEKKKELRKWIDEQKSKYFMLLCRERSDYTVFHIYVPILIDPTVLPIEREIIDIVCSRGRVKAMETIEDNSENVIQFWVEDNDAVYMYALFPYDVGVIECL